MLNQTTRIGIIGGGMGGLTAALALKKIAGIGATVFEQASGHDEVGAGVTVAPNACRQLDRLGVLEPMQEAGAIPDGHGVYLDSMGNMVTDAAWVDSSGKYKNIGMYRPDVMHILADHLPAEAIRFDHRLTSIKEVDTGVRVEFENGHQDEFDAVIGADGIHSAVRESAIHPANKVYSGYICYRGVLDASLLPEGWPRISQVWMGNERHFMFYPLQQHKIYNFIGFVPSDKPQTTGHSSGPADVSELAAEFAGDIWDPKLHHLISLIDETFWWALTDIDPLSIWTRGHIALLGDAAHAMIPHQGQGVNMATEDSMALAFFLREAGSVSDIPRAFKRYAAVRQQRAAILQVGSRRAGAMFDAQYQFRNIKKRDIDIRAGRDFRRRSVFDYDVVKVCEKALERFNRS